MKKLILCALTISLFGCGAQKNIENADVMKYANTITAADLSEHLYIFASDEFEGRNTGEPGQKMAAEYLVTEYKKLNIPSPAGVTNYYQPVPSTAFRGDVKDTENVLAYIEGSEKPEEVLVITSHYDHVGMDKEGNVFNGADDDGSGTVAILEIAEAFMKAKEDGYHPKRSILFMNVTGEEKGLIGSKWYTDNDPIFPLAQTVANLNIDMIGRVGNGKEDAGDYVYLIGSDKLSTELHDISEEVNNKYINMELDYTFNDENDPNRFYFRSDHYNFAKNGVPIIFYFNGVHADYHKISDTPDKINYDMLAKRAQLIFLTAWEVVNRENRPVVDKTPPAPPARRQG